MPLSSCRTCHRHALTKDLPQPNECSYEVVAVAPDSSSFTAIDLTLSVDTEVDSPEIVLQKAVSLWAHLNQCSLTVKHPDLCSLPCTDYDQMTHMTACKCNRLFPFWHSIAVLWVVLRAGPSRVCGSSPQSDRGLGLEIFVVCRDREDAHGLHAIQDPKSASRGPVSKQVGGRTLV